MENRKIGFIEDLYSEKLKHKDHRLNLVLQKILFTIGLFGLGILTIQNVHLEIILYLIPFIALAYDMYILSEDYKVKRIGFFIQYGCKESCRDERAWEDWVSNKREPMGAMASVLLTFVVIFASAITIYNYIPDHILFYIWLPITFVSLILIFVYAYLLCLKFGPIQQQELTKQRNKIMKK